MLSYSIFAGRFWHSGCRIAVLFACITFVYPQRIYAWVYPEHRLITIAAIQKLSYQQRNTLNFLWSLAQQQYKNRFSISVIDTAKSEKVRLLDFAAWPAIAGDHSCSPAEMLHTITNSTWISGVNEVGVKLGERLLSAKNNSQRSNYLRMSDMQLLKKDDAYASRAGVNSVHFLLPRNTTEISLIQYIQQCTRKGASLNAMGVYTYFHQLAMQKLWNYWHESEQTPGHTSLLIAALADEAFAIHFLQDAFAAGHIAGSWGGAALQKGTHDHYNEEGLEIETWAGKRKVVKGDAYITEEDIQLVSTVVSQSLTQLFSVVLNSQMPLGPGDRNPDGFNVCTNTTMPDFSFDTAMINEMVSMTPIPGLASGAGSLPRFRAELGPFIGISTGISGMSVSGGFGPDQNEAGALGGLEANIRFGLGLDGVVNQSGDGLIFIDAGWKQESSSSNNIFYSGGAVATNAITSAIPARSAYNLRLRMPFCIIPGDLILAAPVLGLLAPKLYKKMAIAAVNGGLIPWQSALHTGIGRFQIILGREMGVSLYGLRSPRDYLILPDNNNQAILIEYRSTKIEFPVIEYRPYKSFTANQSSGILLQLYTGTDIPHRVRLLAPSTATAPALQQVWFAGIRVLFNWRRYL
ncbi:hypothetical protein [Sediminibacterium goheungense]|uniref:Uncharacterized protein n=1 Tax=Sediminibacterium goheungense TaxID=1086393 RepID=A0A4V3C4C1_9BACT|nr:hypothetical protein [Sediminibacterium goheungense]TDO25378.1 hypothetical protein BC659_2919 [Sediminibacterium goheungense]